MLSLGPTGPLTPLFPPWNRTGLKQCAVSWQLAPRPWPREAAQRVPIQGPPWLVLSDGCTRKMQPSYALCVFQMPEGSAEDLCVHSFGHTG